MDRQMDRYRGCHWGRATASSMHELSQIVCMARILMLRLQLWGILLEGHWHRIQREHIGRSRLTRRQDWCCHFSAVPCSTCGNKVKRAGDGNIRFVRLGCRENTYDCLIFQCSRLGTLGTCGKCVCFSFTYEARYLYLRMRRLNLHPCFTYTIEPGRHHTSS
jgi:hypothetical protein